MPAGVFNSGMSAKDDLHRELDRLGGHLPG